MGNPRAFRFPGSRVLLGEDSAPEEQSSRDGTRDERPERRPQQRYPGV
jgi:hypothetical protein